MADITLIGGLIFAGLLSLPIPDGCDALKSWHAAMMDRPSVKNRVAMSEPPQSPI
jgi:glutathione S-transferase